MTNKLVLTPAWNGLKQQVLHLAQFGGSIQVVQGAEGAGKSTFLKFLGTEDFSLPLITLSVSRQQSPEAFFLSLLQNLGLQPSPSAAYGELIAQLRQFVQAQYSSQARVVVAIDDAHFLAEPSIAALISVLQGGTDSGFGLHLIFLSEPGLAEVIDSLNLLDITVHDQTLPSFSPSELKELLLEYLSGKPDAPLVSVEEIHTIWVDSKGLPGRALKLAKAQYEPDEQHEGSGFSLRGLPLLHIGALIFLGLILFWAFGMGSNEEKLPPVNNDSVAFVSEHATRHVRTAGPSNLSQVELNGFEGSSVESVPSSNSEGEGRAVKPLTTGTVNEGAALHNDGANEDVLLSDEAAELPEETLVQNESYSSSLHELDAQDPEEVFKVSVSSDTSDTEIDSPEVSVSNVARKPAAPDVTVDPDRAKFLDDPVEKYLADSKARILEYSESGFAIQLMALVDLPKLMEFVSAQPNQDSLHVYQASRSGRQVYILLQGFYSDKKSALTAVASLPSSQRKAGPWPKSYRSIQSEIVEN